MDYTTFIPLDHINLWDAILKRSSFIFIDRGDTIDHLLNIPKAKIIKKHYSPESGYEVNILRVPDQYVNQVEEVMNKLNDSLMIKDPKYIEEYKKVMESLIKMVSSI